MPNSAGNSIKAKEQEWNHFFKKFESWKDKYSAIIDLGKRLSPYPDDKRTNEFMVKGCQSQVWLWASQDQNSRTMLYWADSDALITKGLVAFLVLFYSDLNPQDIVQHDIQYFKNLGLADHLSPSRANGFFNMINQMKRYATAFHLLNRNSNHNPHFINPKSGGQK